ncbi:hypothetical protein QJS04_geneDACA009438 [Acorus gramineus]|uniref:Uncharacterized protein n=1 Tax=Acorus gramineus TaxID=55184 RepID=A0AAV9AFT1_ACOGR|nr:hypothetical protein QJS04_geneDACA009438 [Acorus gramineus]
MKDSRKIYVMGLCSQKKKYKLYYKFCSTKFGRPKPEMTTKSGRPKSEMAIKSGRPKPEVATKSGRPGRIGGKR